MKSCTFKGQAAVRLTVYFREAGGPRALTGDYTRSQAALRLKWTRHLENFKGHKTEALR